MTTTPADAGVAELIWTAEDHPALVARPTDDPARRTVGRYRARPSLEHVTTLVPRGRAASGPLRRISAQHGPLARVARLAAFPAASVGAMSLLGGTDVDLQVDPSSAGPAGLLQEIAGRLGAPPLSAVVYLGPPRPNRKPVLQLLDRSARPVAWAKVAPTDLTRRLLATERAALERADRLAPPGGGLTVLRTPRVLAAFTWEGAEVLVTAALPISWWYVRRGRAAAVDAAAREIVALGDRSTGPLGDSTWFVRTRQRLVDAGCGDTAETLDGLASAPHPVSFGAWHGDFTSWNHDVVRRSVTVWDWERFDPDVPVGLDLVHLAFQETLQRTQQPVETVHALTVDHLDPARLVATGAHPETASLVPLLYLAELLARYAEDRSLASSGRYERWCTELTTTIRAATARHLAG